MLSDLLQDVSLFRILHQIDRDLAESCRQGRCPHCQGSFHYAPYLRKPRGGPEKIPEEYLFRFSLCCGREGCWRGVLPPSCLFMGRRVYWQAVILAVMTMRQARANGIGANRLMRMFSIPRKTIVRWISYFRSEFAVSREWLRIRGRVDATVGNEGLPVVWLNSYEVAHVHALWHLDFHSGSRRIVDSQGGWHTPKALCVIDDCSRLCCHIQWDIKTASRIASGANSKGG